MNNRQHIETPILLIWFNRPNHAQRILNRLRTIQPTFLYIAIDGPRAEHPTDAEQVSETIALLDQIDWPCTVHRLLRSTNLGCKQGVSSAISWFFEQVEAGIILEDDCLPEPSFFTYCTELLARYATNEQVMHIGGTNLVAGNWEEDTSYVFTKVCHIWGWATWRRAWQQYDLTMSTYLSQGESLIKQVVLDQQSRVYWKSVFDEAYANQVDTWDYQWVYSIWATNGLCILPCVNLVTNIGFDAAATHTKSVTVFANLPSGSLPELHHPEYVAEDKAMNAFLFRKLYRLPSTLTVWLQKIKRGVDRLKR